MVDIDMNSALIVLILNFAAPQLGTLLAAFMDKRGFNGSTLVLGIVQGVLTYTIFVGYIWGIIWSIQVLEVAKKNYGHHDTYSHHGGHHAPPMHFDAHHGGHHGGHYDGHHGGHH